MVLLINKKLALSGARAFAAAISSLAAFAIWWRPSKLSWNYNDTSFLDYIVVIATVGVFITTFCATMIHQRINRLVLTLLNAAIGSASGGILLGLGGIHDISELFYGLLKAAFMGGIAIFAGFGAAYPLVLIASVLFYGFDWFILKSCFNQRC